MTDTFTKNLLDFFFGKDPANHKKIIADEKRMRENLSEEQIDKTLKDSFPSSDPPAWF
ncbi:MAG TPA: hypothetical protein VFR09_03330 [Alphaproteobacteria bacterium]|nr:hypothetical protein [Alphaproteobacteria bacterium]